MPEPKFHQKIAWFNFICCLMVIWTHSGNADLFFPELGQDAPWWHFQYPVMQEILRVDIPCFIMLSAYLFYRNFTMKRLGEKLNKRLHSLLVPYLLWNTIYYVAYVAASRIPGLRTIANRTDLVITPSGAWQAITKYTFNPVFWFMYQIILLVLLAPVLYLFLKNIWTGAAFLLVLLVALFKGVALPELNLDALIYYSFAAYAALHGRKWAEAVWSWKRAALGVCLLAVGIAKPAVILQYVLETLLIAVVAFPLAYLSSKQVAGTLGTLFGKAAENVIVTPEHFMLVAIVGGVLLVAAVLVSSISTMRLKPKQILSQME